MVKEVLIGAIEALWTMYRDGRPVLPKRILTSFIKPAGAKSCRQPKERLTGAYEIVVIVHLRERLGSGSIWVAAVGRIARLTITCCRCPRSTRCDPMATCA